MNLFILLWDLVWGWGIIRGKVGKMVMGKQVYITEEERRKCQKVVDAYAELYEKEDIVVLDAGKYGFVKLQYYKFNFGFYDNVIFTNSQELFDDLWKEWFNMQLLILAKETTMTEIRYDDIFNCQSKEKQKEIMSKRHYFEEKCNS